MANRHSTRVSGRKPKSISEDSTSEQNRIVLHVFTATKLPALARALERRYPGVTVGACEKRLYAHGHEGFVYEFHTTKPDLLVEYGLASLGKEWKSGRRDLLAATMAETTGSGVHSSGNGAYVFHGSHSGEPDVGKGRVFPLKKTQAEFDRIWKRIKAPRKARPMDTFAQGSEQT
jgi:hypothetical protein